MNQPEPLNVVVSMVAEKVEGALCGTERYMYMPVEWYHATLIL